MAQLVEYRAVVREVAGSNPGRTITRGLKITQCCLCNDICKWLDSLVFSDKDDKLFAPSHNLSMFITLWDVKEPTHHLQRVGHEVRGVVVRPYFIHSYALGWVRSLMD